MSALRCFFGLLFITAAHAAEPFTVRIDTGRAPECEAFAARSKVLVEEWYPKINEILFAKGHPLPASEITLVFEPRAGVAATVGNTISISAEWVTRKAPNDYGMVIHELTHVVQDYRGKGEGWLTEGIADYIRDRYFEPGARHPQIRLGKGDYHRGYEIAAAFLIWLEENKAPDLVRTLNIASHEGRYRPEMFRELCGADLDTLWKELAATPHS